MYLTTTLAVRCGVCGVCIAVPGKIAQAYTEGTQAPNPWGMVHVLPPACIRAGKWLSAAAHVGSSHGLGSTHEGTAQHALDCSVAHCRSPFIGFARAVCFLVLPQALQPKRMLRHRYRCSRSYPTVSHGCDRHKPCTAHASLSSAAATYKCQTHNWHA